MTTYKSTYIAAVVHRVGDNPIINEQSTTVTICDEAGGAFVSLTDSEGTTIKLDPEEFEIVANVAKGMLECFEDKPRTPISVINDSFNKSEAIIRSFEDGMLDEDDKEIIRPATPFAATCDLLAVIHRDGGQHTGEVGTVQSCKDAEAVVHALMLDRALLGGAMKTSDSKIVNRLLRYIDRMNDVCDEDPADKILREFVADVMPFINDRNKQTCRI